MVANAVILPEKTKIKKMIISTRTMAMEPVFWKRMRYGAVELIAVSRSLMQNSIVMSMMMPTKTLRT